MVIRDDRHDFQNLLNEILIQQSEVDYLAQLADAESTLQVLADLTRNTLTITEQDTGNQDLKDLLTQINEMVTSLHGDHQGS